MPKRILKRMSPGGRRKPLPLKAKTPNGTMPAQRTLNPANRINDAVEAVISEHQDRIWEAQGILDCAYHFLEQDPDDPSPARWAMEAALRQLCAASYRLERTAINHDADAYEAKLATEAAGSAT